MYVQELTIVLGICRQGTLWKCWEVWASLSLIACVLHMQLALTAIFLVPLFPLFPPCIAGRRLPVARREPYWIGSLPVLLKPKGLFRWKRKKRSLLPTRGSKHKKLDRLVTTHSHNRWLFIHRVSLTVHRIRCIIDHHAVYILGSIYSLDHSFHCSMWRKTFLVAWLPILL